MTVRAAAAFLALAALSGCGSDAKKPSDADIAAYLAQSEPAYLRVSGVKPVFEAISSLGSKTLPAGSWRVKVAFMLHTAEDLYAPAQGARENRAAFDHAVAAFEQYRVARISAAEQLAMKIGLMKQGDATPEPAVPVSVVNHANQDLNDSVTLLAQPDGTGWKFAQLSAQALADDAIGATLADIKATSPHTVFVMAGSDDDKSYALRQQRYLATLAKALAKP